jgi:hypothetical protein
MKQGSSPFIFLLLQKETTHGSAYQPTNMGVNQSIPPHCIEVNDDDVVVVECMASLCATTGRPASK